MKKYIKQLFLTWRKGSGGRRITVGIIKKNITDGVTFSYIDEGVNEAKKYGFIPYEGFPDIKKNYDTNVLQIFSHRLIKNERQDSKYFYDFWEIDENIKNDNYKLLAYTQGLIPTDNFEFLADFNPIKGLKFVTEISGLSKQQVDSNLLVDGDTIEYILETRNRFDEYAVALYKDDVKLGYVKKINSKVFYHSKFKFKITVKSLEKNGVLKRAFIKVEY